MLRLRISALPKHRFLVRLAREERRPLAAIEARPVENPSTLRIRGTRDVHQSVSWSTSSLGVHQQARRPFLRSSALEVGDGTLASLLPPPPSPRAFSATSSARLRLRPLVPDDQVLAFSAPGESRECVEVARRVLDLAKHGIAFDRMAVLLRSPEEYRAPLEEAFVRAGVPAHFARGAVRPDPSGRALYVLLRCAAERLQRVGLPSTCRLVRCPMPIPGSGTAYRTMGSSHPGSSCARPPPARAAGRAGLGDVR